MGNVDDKLEQPEQRLRKVSASDLQNGAANTEDVLSLHGDQRGFRQ